MDGGPEYLVVGHVSKPHGTKGELLIWVLTDTPEAVLGPGRRVLIGDETGAPEAVTGDLSVAEARPYRKGWLVRFEGVEDRSGAESLVGRYLLAPVTELVEPEAGEVYYHDLLGLAVETVGGEVVGRVREVYETEPDHLLEVKGEGRVRLIPFTRRIVTELDLERGRLVIDPPEGLLDL